MKLLNLHLTRSECYGKLISERVQQTGSLSGQTPRFSCITVFFQEIHSFLAQSMLESLRRFLNKDRGLKTYKVQLNQELKPHERLMRYIIVRWTEERMSISFHLCLIFV